MPNCHVAVTKEIESQWANGNTVECYDVIRKKHYRAGIDTLGTERDYYDEHVEEDILAKDVENKFGIFLKEYLAENDPIKMHNDILDKNHDVIIKYINCMFWRSKVTLKDVNEKSVFAHFVRPISHSEMILACSKIKSNILAIVSNKIICIPLICQPNDGRLINNSVGFCLPANKYDGSHELIVPLSPYRALVFSDDNPEKRTISHYEATPLIIKKINKQLCISEKRFGNGFVFAKEKEDLCVADEYFGKY